MRNDVQQIISIFDRWQVGDRICQNDGRTPGDRATIIAVEGTAITARFDEPGRIMIGSEKALRAMRWQRMRASTAERSP